MGLPQRCFGMTEKMDSRFRGNDRKKTVLATTFCEKCPDKSGNIRGQVSSEIINN